MAQRQSHVKRIFRVDPHDGSVDTGVWIDVMRIDKLTLDLRGEESGVQDLEFDYVLLWNDDPFNKGQNGADDSNADKDYENANAVRTTKQLEVKNPDSPDDSSQSAFLWIIKELTLNGRGMPDGSKSQDITLVFNNTPATDDDGNTVRQVTVIQVVNNDLVGNAMDDGNGNAIITDWDIYKEWLIAGQNDTGTKLNVEVTDNYTIDFRGDESGNPSQTVEFVLDNQEIDGVRGDTGQHLGIALFPLGDPGAVDADGMPSVIRTDPLQIIVNCQFGGLAVEFFDGSR